MVYYGFSAFPRCKYANLCFLPTSIWEFKLAPPGARCQEFSTALPITGHMIISMAFHIFVPVFPLTFCLFFCLFVYLLKNFPFQVVAFPFPWESTTSITAEVWSCQWYPTTNSIKQIITYTLGYSWFTSSVKPHSLLSSTEACVRTCFTLRKEVSSSKTC